MSARKCIVSFGNDTGNYKKALQRLETSLRPYQIDFIGFTKEEQVGAPPHSWLPYAFKVYAIKKVREQMGYDQIVWLDSSVVAIKDPAPVFAHLDEHGYIMQESGHYVTDWMNGAHRTEFNVKAVWTMYGNAGFLGLDFRNETAAKFFNMWYGYRYLFAGSWENSRHDMTVGSIIANDLGMKFQSGNDWLEYGPVDTPGKNATIIFKASGL